MEKCDDERLKDVFIRMKQLEKQYDEMSREDLIGLLVLRQMADEAMFEGEGHKIKLWCYVADETGLKYLTNAMPTKYFTDSEPLGVFITDGDINIRVPAPMFGMFPDLKYGDEPMKVSLSVSF